MDNVRSGSGTVSTTPNPRVLHSTGILSEDISQQPVENNKEDNRSNTSTSCLFCTPSGDEGSKNILHGLSSWLVGSIMYRAIVSVTLLFTNVKQTARRFPIITAGPAHPVSNWRVGHGVCYPPRIECKPEPARCSSGGFDFIPAGTLNQRVR